MELDQALQALQALYTSHDKATIKQADDWLTKFQQTLAAWQVSDTILSRTDLPLQFRFFAAQTMRTKVELDFYELPAESYNSLQDSLLSHIDRFRAHEFRPIHTMLAIALADLAIQMDVAWPDAVQTLFARFGQSPDSYSTLLEVLRMLPEEHMNCNLTDTDKRNSSRERLQQAATHVVQFLPTLQCPTVHTKKKVFECFLSWIKFAQLQPSDLSQNPLIPECFKNVTQGGELSEPAADIIVEILRMSSLDLKVFQPLLEVILSHLDPLRQKFQTILSQGVEQAVEADQDGLLQICRIYVEVGECLLPLIIRQIRNVEVLSILRVILQCTDLPCQEISSIPFDFWQRLANEISEKPETDMQVDQFQGIFSDLLGVVIQRGTISLKEDPFQMDDDAVHYRQRLRNLADDCRTILTPNSALEHELKSVPEGQARGDVVQEPLFVFGAAASSAAPSAAFRPRRRASDHRGRRPSGLAAALDARRAAVLEQEIAAHVTDLTVEELRKRTAELESEREELRKRTAELESEREELRKRTAELESEREELRKRTAELESEREELRKRTAELESERDSATSRVMELTKEMEWRLHVEVETMEDWLRQKDELVERVQQLERERRRRTTPAEVTFEQKAEAIAALECAPLKQLTLLERLALQKKILLKWHPDKQPTEDHKRLATKVVQGMQNTSDWAKG